MFHSTERNELLDKKYFAYEFNSNLVASINVEKRDPLNYVAITNQRLRSQNTP